MSVSGIGNQLLSTAAQQAMAKMRGANDSPEEFASSFVSDKDSDGDGLLTLSEAGIEESQFTSADTDGDGYLTQDEIIADMEQRHQQMGMLGQISVQMSGTPNNMADTIISQLDSDDDGMITQEESGLEDELFSALDTDQDGSISSEELNSAMAPPELSAAETASSAEAATETSAQSTQSQGTSSSSSEDDEDYDTYDLNKDGVVSVDELMQAYLNGDSSLSGILGESSQSNMAQTTLTRIAMQAYQTQSTAV